MSACGALLGHGALLEVRSAKRSKADVDFPLRIKFDYIPQHFKFEHEHSIAGLSTEEPGSSARLIEAGMGPFGEMLTLC